MTRVAVLRNRMTTIKFQSRRTSPAVNIDAAVLGATPLHAETTCELSAPGPTVFDHVDQPQRLSAHMAQRSWQLAGSTMAIEADNGKGRRVGSHVRLAGRVLGIFLCVEVVVVEREPPRLKTWETVGEPRLLVIGRYRMSVRVDARKDCARVTISIDYALPERAPARWFGKALGSLYARWCVGQMARDLLQRFGAPRD